MKLNRHLSLFLLLFFTVMWGNHTFAQISEGGIPPSFTYPDTGMLKQGKSPSLFLVQPDFDVKTQIELDRKEQEESWGGVPLKIGRRLFPNQNQGGIDLIRDGEKTILPDGTEIWRLQIKSPEALAIGLYYDKFYIPQGGKLFIYNPNDKEQLIGAFTNKNSQKVGTKFATELILGDELVLEYVSPFKAEENTFISKAQLPQINIYSIVYGYNYIQNNSHIGTSASCMVNVNCSPEGDNWQDEKKGVAKIYYPIDALYVSWCSGTIVNNTAQDLTPYYLTAFHCIDGDVSWDEMVFYFHFESAACDYDGITPTSTKTMVGAEQMAISTIYGGNGSDGALLKLTNNIPLDYEVYYNGWDRTNPAATFNGVGIHHPSGDLKKISTFEGAYSNPTAINWQGGGQTPAHAHWNAPFVTSINGGGGTEGGSSGSPLFNSNGHVVGTLSGGGSSCAPSSSLYGKLWYHWDQGSSEPLASFLDPIGTDQTSIDGTYVQNQNPEANFSASATDIYVLQSITYKDFSSKVTTWEWTFEGGTPNSFDGKEPPVITYNSLGTFTTTLTINKGTADESTATKTITVTEKGVNPVAPIASFSLDEGVLLEEYFTGTTFPPTGWTVDNRAGTSYTWQRGTNTTSPTPDAVSPTVFAYHRWTEDNPADSWLISPSVTIPANGASVEFYCSGGGAYQGDVWTYLYVIDAGNNEIELWNNGHLNTEPGYVWEQPTISLNAYVGQTIKLAWRYKGYDGDAAMVDAIKVLTAADPDVKLTINVGDYVSPIDLSTGPPILYKWDFPGGDPETSDKEVPGKVRYMTPGVYDVTLWVKNYQGEDTRTLTGAVTVVDLLPEANFDATVDGAYTLTTYGPFAPKEAYVNFSDKTSNYPVSWEWTFDGGEPASSTAQNPGWVHYATEGTFDFAFKAENTAGASTVEIPEFAKIGYTTGNIWNLLPGEDGSIYYTNGADLLTGSNNGISGGYAERFDAPVEPGFFQSVDIDFTVISATSGNLTISVATEAAGAPGTVLEQVSLPVTAINTSGPTTITFDNPVSVDGAFYIVIQGFRQISTYRIAINSSPLREGTAPKNTAYMDYYYDLWGILWLPMGWMPYDEIYSNAAISLNIVPEFTYSYLEIEGETEFIRKNIDPTVGSVNVKTNSPWEATPLASWIAVENGSGNGDGSFTFTVSENKMNARKGLIKVAAGTIEKYVLVLQAGPHPLELTATIIDETTGEIGLDWDAPEILEPASGDYIFEDFESHTSFAINSAGTVGWNYIDGDGANPYRIEADDYPNWGVANAYIIYVPSETTPAITDDTFAPHSGKKYAGFGANQGGVTNNDWIISPELEFEEDFTFSFWAKSITSNYGLERMKVAYSTTGKAQGDFTVVTSGSYVEVPIAWTNYSYTIPANAKHVAINCVSADAFMLVVDDIFIGVGTAPESAYMLESAAPKNSTPAKFTKYAPIQLNRIDYTPEQLQALEDMKTGKVEFNKITFVTDENTGKTTETASENSTVSNPIVNNKLEAYKENDHAKSVETENNLESEKEPVTKLGYTDGVYANAIGVAAGANIETAIRFTPTDLIDFHNKKIKAVDIYLLNEPLDGIRLNVRSGDELVHSQEIKSIAAEKHIRISLNKDVLINATKDLYIGYEYNQKPSEYVAAVSAGPAVIGKGDLISLAGSPFESIGEMGLDYNWIITALVEGDITNPVIDLTYKVYRDDVEIGMTDKLTYLDKIMTIEACYEVSAVYEGFLESIVSNTACVTLPNIPKQPLTVTVEDASRAYGDSNPAFVLHYDGFLDGHSEADLATAPVATCLADATSPVGTYDIVLSGGADLLYDFIYVDARLEVTERPISISADALSKVYGEADPALTYTVTSGSLVNADAITGSLEREAGEDVGNYTINQGTLDINTNYIITYVSNIFSITAKAQTITFPDIPEQTINGGSYILDATASSGLLVKYTVADVTVADLASDGKTVIFKKIGETQITAYVSPDPNYAAATPVTKVLKIKGSNDTSSTLTVSGANTAVAPYTVDCGISSILITVTPNDPYAMVTFNGQSYPNNQYSLATPKGGEYSVSVKVTASDGTTTKEDLLTFEKPFDFFEIGVVRFGNTLVVNNNSSTNGGYTFTAYAWYKDGQNVGNAQAYTNAAGLGTSSYYVVVTSSDGKTFSTCAQSFSSSGAMGVKAYPNPVGVGEQVNVEADLSAEMLEEAVIEVYDAGGVMIQREISVTNINQITMPYITGTYVIRLVSGDYEQTMKVVVK